MKRKNAIKIEILAADTRICNIGYWKHGICIYTKIASLYTVHSLCNDHFLKCFAAFPLCVVFPWVYSLLLWLSRNSLQGTAMLQCASKNYALEKWLWNQFSRFEIVFRSALILWFIHFFLKCVKCLDNNNCWCTFITHIEILLVPNDSHFVF